MSEKSLKVTWDDHLKQLSGLFHDLYENNKLNDVTLYCTGGSLKAHKIVLSACSPYFMKIFQENDFKHPIIILKGISYKEMQLLLEFMYKGSVSVNESDLDPLVQAGSYLEIKGMNVKNIPSDIKKISKRATEEEDSNKSTKKPKENSDGNDSFSQQEPMQIEEAVDENKEAEGPMLSHRRETRFKGQKRVDVHMFSRPFRSKLNSPEVQTKRTEDTSGLTPRLVKKAPSTSKEKDVAKDPLKDIQKDHQAERESTISPALIGRLHKDNVDIFPRFTKSKMILPSQSIIKSSKNDDAKEFPEKKQPDKKSDKYEMNLVITNVFSAEDLKTNVPLNIEEKSSSSHKETLDGDKFEFSPVIPDVVINEGDSEIRCESSDRNSSNDEDDKEIDVQSEDKSFKCSQCKKAFQTEPELSFHIKTHIDRPNKCEFCDAQFQRHSHLIRHRRKHTGERPYACPECGKAYARQDKLKQHFSQHEEFTPSPHYRKMYQLPDEKRGRGRPRKYPVKEIPQEKRPRGRPRKYSIVEKGAHVENYDITNLPYGDFSYLTSPLPIQDFNDLTITPVVNSYSKQPVVQNTEVENIKTKKNADNIETSGENEEIDISGENKLKIDELHEENSQETDSSDKKVDHLNDLNEYTIKPIMN